MCSKLDEIVKKTREDLEERKRRIPLDVMLNSFQHLNVQEPRFRNKFGMTKREGRVGIIAEIKFASPTEPYLGLPTELLSRAKQYEQAGADAISILTEKHYFKGDPLFVSQIKQKVGVPILQKDFIIDPYQIYEAANGGADAILLIAKLISKEELISFVQLSNKLGLEPVVEINDEPDLKKALATNTDIIAVNARDLDSFIVDVNRACKLITKIPQRFVRLAFSGVSSRAEVEKYKRAGADGVLIGTSLMRTNNIKKFIENVRGGNNMAVKVKICATRSLEAAQIAAQEGAEFLGLVFTPHIKTHTVDTKVAKIISKKLKGKINLVGVFQNMPQAMVKKIIEDNNLDYAQFHGDESMGYISQIKIKIIKAFRYGGDFDIEEARKQMKKFKVDFYLVDRIKQSEGPMLNLEKVAILAKEFPLIFAGGLNPENVAEVIKKVRPKMVDVASGVETNELQDLGKIKRFIKNAKSSSL